MEVKVAREGEWLDVRVANTGPAPNDLKGQEGHGLGNLRERLSLLGAPDDAFRLRREGDWTIAELRLRVTV